MKMSKSSPDSAIFMTDSAELIHKKISKAYCTGGQVEDNPLIEYCKYLIFEQFGKLEINRPAKFGGDVVYDNYDKFIESFVKKEIHPMDLKNAVSENLNKMIEPVRKYFETNQEAKKLRDEIQNFSVTK